MDCVNRVWMATMTETKQKLVKMRARRVSTPAGVSSGAKLTKFQVKSKDLVPESKTQVSRSEVRFRLGIQLMWNVTHVNL